MKFLLAFFFFTLNSQAQDLFGLEHSSFHTVRRTLIHQIEDPDLDLEWELGVLTSEDQIDSALISFTDASGAFWTLQIFQNALLPTGPTFFVPHDNENDAFLTGLSAIKTYGGHLISLDCAEQRICAGGIDPNRHFLPNYPLFSETIMAFYFAKDYPVITLHNNHDSHWSLGGSGAIYADLKTPYRGGEGYYHAGDPDDLIIYSDTIPSSESPLFEHFSMFFEKLDINSIFEYVMPGGELGGHMSTYVVLNTDYEYFNIEAQHGHLEEQIDLTEVLLEVLAREL
ncbi:MAG: hypothetical protein CME64_07360 [Halobacteriovoraceae bacterium]|nr:hypothetical protein [Halobacteriovoraceae bacterium]